MFEASIFLTILVFPLLTAPQFNLPALWGRIHWQSPEPIIEFVHQAYARQAVNVCQISYCFGELKSILQPELLAKVPETGFFVLVDVNKNREYVFRDGKLLMENLVSTGSLTRFKSSYYTPLGEWKIVEKKKTNPKSEFGPYFLRLAKLDGKHFVPTSLALHGTNEPELLGQSASHGCIRHANEAISHLFQILPIGTIVETID